MLHRYILHNDTIRDASEPCLTPGQVGLLSGWGVFTTIRVTRGVLFAFERHFARMRRDAKALRMPFPEDPGAFEAVLLRLVGANEAPDCTLRVAVVRNYGGMWQGPVQRDVDLIALTADRSEWGEAAKLGIAEHARNSRCRFEGTKVLSWAFNLVRYEEARTSGLDELVLLNERGEVSECTSANIFAAQGTEVWTPPLSAGCLPGVTRELLLTEVNAPGYRVAERSLRVEDLHAADEVFLTSSTRDALPVESIGGVRLRRAGGACEALRQGLLEYIEQYVLARSGAPAV